MNVNRMRPFLDQFDIAFSFAGAQRTRVRSVAEAVERVVGSGAVFLDEWFEHVIAGLDGDLTLQDIYSRKTKLVVVCVSADYNDRPWTQLEHRAIRALTMSTGRPSLCVLPLRFGEGDVEGIHANAIVPDVRDREPNAIADLILSRLNLIAPSTASDRVGSVPLRPPPLSGAIVFRWWHEGVGDHFYTTDPIGEIAGECGYVDQGPAFRLAPPGSADTVGLYRWYSRDRGDHFYTTDHRGEQAPALGYQPEGLLGYIYTRQLEGTIPLLRWWNPGILDHLYSVNTEEAVPLDPGYNSEGVVGYVIPPSDDPTGTSRPTMVCS